ncbi:MAG: replicative DNA helicase [Solirubrobacteraceae bacterium]|nr:replicative DNA helicase [Solirubrobacteraceae bacterium]
MPTDPELPPPLDDGGADLDLGGFDPGSHGDRADVAPVGPAGHVPPHDLAAERAVLGAYMLSEQARNEISIDHGLRPDDFYAPQHQVTFAAIQQLYEANTTVDAITVSAQLEQNGTLEQAGGRDALWSLTASITEVGALGHHARIVQGRARLRRLQQATFQIQAAIQQGGKPADTIIEESQGLVFELSRNEDRTGLVPAKDLVDGVIEEIETREQNDSDVTGLATGFPDLDKDTAGLQPGAMIVLAARPAMGKSAFVTNLAENVALRNRGAVALFSLEMPEREILERVISSQAGIRNEDVRRGRIGDRWPDLLEVTDKLQSAPLFIDDSSDIGIMEIRAKARKLATSHPQGVALVIVDYLQLMRADGRTENRVQQIGEMSRGLKILAQDLSCPVIALSQLSRGVDSRENKRPLLSDLRECVVGDTLVVRADGRRTPIRDLVGREPDVLAVDDDGRIVEARSDRVWSVGRRPVHRLRLASGRTLRATADHRVLAGPGWRTLGELEAGDRVALSRRLPEPAEPVVWPDDRVILLAHLVGDGSYLSGQPMRYTTACEVCSAAVTGAAEREFGSTVKRHAGRGRWHQLVISGNGNRWHPAGVNRWLRGLGIFGQRSADKRLPEDVFRFDDRAVGLLLRHLWATDGAIWSRMRPGGRSVDARVYFSTCSEALAADVAALLLRLGIVSRTTRTTTPTGGCVLSVDVTGHDAQRRFLDRVGAFGPRAEAAAALRAAIGDRESGTNVDTLPRETWDDVRRSMRERGVTQRGMAAARGTSYGGTSHFRFAPSRATLASYAEVLDDPEPSRRATSDLFWDRVVAVEPDGEEEVYDLTVPGPACWLADGIVTHNSGNIEQDADLVMFLYRDDYYNKESPEPGVAELIIAKNRSGRTGSIRLLFQGEYPRFLTMAQTGQQDGGPPARVSGAPGGGPPLPGGGGPPLPQT